MSDHSNALRLAAFTIAIYVTAVTLQMPLLYYLSYVMAAVLAASFVWSQLNKRELAVRRKLQPNQAQVGQVVQELIEVQNASWLPKLWLEVRDRSTLPRHHIGAVISLGGRKSKQWRVRTRCTHRGLYHLGPTAVLSGDPFGLFRVSRLFGQTSELLVYPPTVPLSSFGIVESELPGGMQTQLRAYHTTPNAAGIRDYMPGDSMNRIHWPASARTQKLMVKEFELDPTADIWLALDLEEEMHAYCPQNVASSEDAPTITVRASALPYVLRPRSSPDAAEPEPIRLKLDPNTEEYAVTVTGSLAAHLISQGRSVGFMAWGQHRVLIPADRGGRQLIKILRALAVLRAEGVASLGELLVAESRQFSRQDTVIVVTPSLDEEWVAALRGQMNHGMRGLAVIVEPSTFCGGGNALAMVGTLSSQEIPTYLVKRDDSIDASLSQQYGASSVRHMR